MSSKDEPTMLNILRSFFAAQAANDGAAGTTGAEARKSRGLVKRTVEGLNRDINVKQIHSRNDYRMYSPLTCALQDGVQSVEADVWCFPDSYTQKREIVSTSFSHGDNNSYRGDEEEDDQPIKDEYAIEEITKEFDGDQIYVGHNKAYLDPESTLDRMYLKKIHAYLKSANSESVHSDASKQQGNAPGKEPKNGLFYNSPESPFYLWLDFKTDPHQTYRALQKSLQKLIDEDYLAYYDAAARELHPGPVLITITGNIPWDLIEAEQTRYVFVDAPLKDFAARLDGDINVASKLKKYAELAVFASASLQDLLVGGQEEFKAVSRKPSFDTRVNQRLKSIFDLAHTYGLKTRVWGDVTFPEFVRDGHLKELYQDGSDFLNADESMVYI